MLANVEVDALEAVAPEIWDMMLGLPIEPVEHPGPVPEGSRTITGLVTIVGEWSGAVTLETTTAAARAFAAAMFGADDPDEMPLEEVRDAHAELVNMTGGNIKNLLPGVHRLGIPTVTEGIGYTITLPRTKPVRSLAYRCGDDIMIITMFEAA